MTILGIDPGINSAYALIDDTGSIVLVEDMPTMGDGTHRRVDAANLANAIRELRPSMAVVEQVGAMPGQGVSSTFRFGMALGTIVGVLGALGVPIQWVTPAKWKCHYSLSKEKDKARLIAIETFPNMASRLTRVKDHNRSEAMLIALWGWKNTKRN